MNKCSFHSKLVLLLGVSGVGKSTVLDYFENELSFDSAPKYTTRKRRDDPSEDIHFIFCESLDEFPESTLAFYSYGDYFGIQLDKIEESLREGKNHVLIIGDPETAKKLKLIFDDSVIVVLIFCEYYALKKRFDLMESLERKNRWNTVEKETGKIYEWLDVVNYILDCSTPFEVTKKKIDLLIRDIESLCSEDSYHIVAKY